MTRRALLLPLFLLAGCGAAEPPEPAPGAVEKTLKQLEANEQATKAEAITVSRARERERLDAAEERLENAQ
ncbi:MAG TPA: hypothetical protein VGD19_03170 [Allosphingosinicella sp.]|jgi:hypothetical protein